MLNGLDLFSGIGGLTLALAPWVQPAAYCENDKYAQGVLLSRMRDGRLPIAPIWDDVRTLSKFEIPDGTDIIYGGFPCQDISQAGRGVGLGGQRSSLFFEVLRLANEIKPQLVFLENVPAIRTRGLNHVAEALAIAGYDCRWDFISAQEVGAPHLRKRWFLLAHSMREGRWIQSGRRIRTHRKNSPHALNVGEDATGARRNGTGSVGPKAAVSSGALGEPSRSSWWATEPNVGRVAHGVPFRVDRLRGLGNSVVPAQAREAFMRLMGLESIPKDKE